MRGFMGSSILDLCHVLALGSLNGGEGEEFGGYVNRGVRLFFLMFIGFEISSIGFCVIFYFFKINALYKKREMPTFFLLG